MRPSSAASDCCRNESQMRTNSSTDGACTVHFSARGSGPLDGEISMCFLIERSRRLRRGAQAMIRRRCLTLFVALFCVCALARTAGAQEPLKGLSKDQVIRLLKED